MRVFISSLIRGMGDYRDAVAHALTVLGHDVKRAEDYDALPDSPQRACLAGVRDANVVILLLGAAYGDTQELGLSATHEEYREAKERCDVLAFVQQDVTRGPAQDAFAQEVRDWSGGQYTGRYQTPEDLRDQVTKAVHALELSRATGRVDETEMLARARRYIPEDDRNTRKTSLSLIVAGGPKQQVLRPADIENQDLQDKLTDRAWARNVQFFSRRFGTEPQIVNHALTLTQEHTSILLDELGTIRLMQSLELPRGMLGSKLGAMFPGVIEEDVEEAIGTMLRFAGWILDEIDPIRRLSDVALILAFSHSGYPSWKTRAEYEREGNAWTSTGHGIPNPIVIEPTVVTYKRATLLHETDRLSGDFAVLLRRAIRG